MLKDRLCEKCKRSLKQFGGFARAKKEGQPVQKPTPTSWVCIYDDCENFNKKVSE